MTQVEKFKNLATALLAIMAAVGIPLVGHWVTKAIKDREVQGKFVELSVGILRDKPTDETKTLRKWAVGIINQYSGVNLPEDELVNTLALPQRESDSPAKSIRQTVTFHEDGGPIVIAIKSNYAVIASYVVYFFDPKTQKTAILCRSNLEPLKCELGQPNAAYHGCMISFQGRVFSPEPSPYNEEITIKQNDSVIGHASLTGTLSTSAELTGLFELKSDKQSH
jgi:hypothetical protein